MLASQRRSTAHRSNRSRHDTAASAMSGSCMRSKSAASMWRLKSALNSRRLQHSTGVCDMIGTGSAPRRHFAHAVACMMSNALLASEEVLQAATHLRLSEARGARSASSPSASSSLVFWNLPPVKVCRACSWHCNYYQAYYHRSLIVSVGGTA